MENGTSKKGVLIGGVAIVLVITAVLLWFFFIRGSTSGVDNILGGSGFAESPNTPSNSGTQGNGSAIDSPGTMPDPQGGELPLFFQLSDVPVAGIFTTEIGNKLRYVEKEKGHIYELTGLSKESTQKISNTTIPRVREAYFGNGGESVIMRYLEEANGYGKDVIKTYLGRIGRGEGDGQPGTIDGVFLADNILEVSVSPNTNSLAFLVPTEDGSSLQSMDLIDRKPKELLRSPISGWLPFLTNKGTVLLQSKASSKVPGYLYRYDSTKKTFEKVASNRLGMTSLPNQVGDKALFSENISGNPVFAVAGVAVVHEGETLRNDTPIGISSFGEKCVWAKDQRHTYCASFSSIERNVEIPDAWYQGVTTLNDSFWRIDTETGEIEILGDPHPETGQSMDATHLALSSDETMLYFINKTDGILWGMRVRTQSQANPEATPTYSPEELRDIEGSTN